MNRNMMERLQPVISTVLKADIRLLDGPAQSKAESNLRCSKYPGRLQDSSHKSIMS